MKSLQNKKMSFSEDFKQTTHYNWLFTTEKVKALRKKNYDNLVREYSKIENSSETEIPSFFELEALREAYEKQLWQLCDHLKLPMIVKVNAITYFKRFYLNYDIVRFDPEEKLLASIFLASKASDHWLKVERISKPVGKSSDIIIKNEIPLLQGINYNLLIHHPHLPLEKLLAEAKFPLEKTKTATKNALSFLQFCYLSDIIFSQTHSFLALSAFLHASNELGSDEFSVAERLIKSSYEKFDLEKLMEECQILCGDYLGREVFEEKVRLKSVKRRILKVRNIFGCK